MCGTPVRGFVVRNKNTPAPSQNLPNPDDDTCSIGWIILGWLTMYVLAIIPLVLICVWKKYPKRIRSIFWGVLVSIVVNLILVIVLGIAIALEWDFASEHTNFTVLLVLFFVFPLISWIIWGGIISLIYAMVKN